MTAQYRRAWRHQRGGRKMFVGIAFNQMGLACVQIDEIEEDVELSEEAKCVLEQECGIYHAETLGVYNNLAGAYDAIGRLEDAIVLVGHVVGAREEKLGTANLDTEEEKRRLTLIDSDLLTSSALR
ncbi:unnamed protein product [Brassica rapa]|uniref:Uncharacterized protein n=1 Tax=Brassica campestris TaxID=3711 RepID=A0A3P6BLR2_BRACM|nr:unnamed protein product [Brassica rapa]VDD06483.1 unnamed protein product [Brassica rapa]